MVIIDTKGRRYSFLLILNSKSVLANNPVYYVTEEGREESASLSNGEENLKGHLNALTCYNLHFSRLIVNVD